MFLYVKTSLQDGCRIMQKSNLDVTNNSELEKCSCFETFVPLQLLLQAQLSWLMFDLGCDSVFVNFN